MQHTETPLSPDPRRSDLLLLTSLLGRGVFICSITVLKLSHWRDSKLADDKSVARHEMRIYFTPTYIALRLRHKATAMQEAAGLQIRA